MLPSLATIKWIAAAVTLLVVFGFGWSHGSEHVQAKWDSEKAALNAEAARQIQEAQEQVRKVEQDSVRRVAAADAKYQAVLREKKSEESAAIDRARTGGLRINAKCPSSPNAVSDSAASTSNGNGETRAELSQEAGEFLVRLAAEADRVTEQLNACQAILEEDRK
jgi:vacuolar-type H+-ATPase subunit I/STV1